jgi:chaperone modulatory protein CbpM
MTHPAVHLFEARVLGDEDWIAAEQVCELCHIDIRLLSELADLGWIDPRGGSSPEQWELPATVLPRLRTVARLMRDLDLNVNGAALAVELLEAQRAMEHRIRELERLIRANG